MIALEATRHGTGYRVSKEANPCGMRVDRARVELPRGRDDGLRDEPRGPHFRCSCASRTPSGHVKKGEPSRTCRSCQKKHYLSTKHGMSQRDVRCSCGACRLRPRASVPIPCRAGRKKHYRYQWYYPAAAARWFTRAAGGGSGGNLRKYRHHPPAVHVQSSAVHADRHARGRKGAHPALRPADAARG